MNRRIMAMAVFETGPATGTPVALVLNSANLRSKLPLAGFAPLFGYPWQGNAVSWAKAAASCWLTADSNSATALRLSLELITGE